MRYCETVDPIRRQQHLHLLLSLTTKDTTGDETREQQETRFNPQVIHSRMWCAMSPGQDQTRVDMTPRHVALYPQGMYLLTMSMYIHRLPFRRQIEAMIPFPFHRHKKAFNDNCCRQWIYCRQRMLIHVTYLRHRHMTMRWNRQNIKTPITHMRLLQYCLHVLCLMSPFDSSCYNCHIEKAVPCSNQKCRNGHKYRNCVNCDRYQQISTTNV